MAGIEPASKNILKIVLQTCPVWFGSIFLVKNRQNPEKSSFVYLDNPPEADRLSISIISHLTILIENQHERWLRVIELSSIKRKQVQSLD